jgi:crossover junction endodeoxyribonuclease RuvC
VEVVTVRVLGIDPGSQVTGWGLVESTRAGMRAVAAGVACPVGRGPASRLGELAGALEALLEEWQPSAVAMERAFVGRNVQSAFRLGEVRGALLAVAGRRGLDVVDYPPATVKVAVTGFGRAEKEAVALGVRRLVGGTHAAGDSTDALAVAICHLLHARFSRRLAEPAGPPASAGRRRSAPQSAARDLLAGRIRTQAPTLRGVAALVRGRAALVTRR